MAAFIFPYKPGPLNRAPGWAAPFQPRLDWQMWFAALGTYRENPWMLHFMMRLLQGSPPVLQLIEQNPFPYQPPKYIRAMVYRYRFTNFDERRQTGNWWKRESLGTYFPPSACGGNNRNSPTQPLHPQGGPPRHAAAHLALTRDAVRPPGQMQIHHRLLRNVQICGRIRDVD